MTYRNRVMHGLKRHPLYSTWLGMLNRCFNPRTQRYADYGGRGITVCDQWRYSFPSFLQDMGERPSPNHSLDRINNDLGYEPANVRWATRLEQGRNRRNNVLLTFNGRTQTLSDWGRETGLGKRLLRDRLKKLGWTTEEALSLPRQS